MTKQKEMVFTCEICGEDYKISEISKHVYTLRGETLMGIEKHHEKEFKKWQLEKR